MCKAGIWFVCVYMPPHLRKNMKLGGIHCKKQTNLKHLNLWLKGKERAADFKHNGDTSATHQSFMAPRPNGLATFLREFWKIKRGAATEQACVLSNIALWQVGLMAYFSCQFFAGKVQLILFLFFLKKLESKHLFHYLAWKKAPFSKRFVGREKVVGGHNPLVTEVLRRSLWLDLQPWDGGAAY